MKHEEKADLLKSTIEQLYSKQGQSISAISRLLEINRRVVSKKIKDWNLPEAEPRHHLTKSTQKFLNKNRQLIIARLNAMVPISKIATELKCDRGLIEKVAVKYDPEIKAAYEEYLSSYGSIRESRTLSSKDEECEDLIDTGWFDGSKDPWFEPDSTISKYKDSSLCYEFEDIPGEKWKTILGYEEYMISNIGRVKKYVSTYKRYVLIKPIQNKESGRLYVYLYHDGIRKAFQVSRLVGHAFVSGRTKERNTINHIDGDVTNNKSTNLCWTTQSENNKHAYDKLNRPVNKGKHYKFKRIVYKGKYEFKTVAAFARFINKSETQARRYLDNPLDHEIELK